jgi:DNA polymerase III subunit gamma/tau
MVEIMELYRKYRPRRFKDVIGQSEAISVLQSKIDKDDVPHALLFSGPSGVGKTTVARILRRKLKCSERDFYEMNAADKNGVGDIRVIRQRMWQSPGPNSECKIYLFDEAHRLTPEAQTALLKMLEDYPDKVYFILCTTEPSKIKETVQTRCTHIKFKPVKPKDMFNLIRKIAGEEGFAINKDVTDKIVEVADGSPRKALVITNQVKDIKDADEQLAIIEKEILKVQGFQIAQALIYNKPWKIIAKMCQEVEEEPEAVRRIILGYARKVLLGGGKFSKRAYLVIESFAENWYDSGLAGLARSAFEVCNTK